MQYYRCKCGQREAWTSMGVSPCSFCPSCKSDYAQGPDGHEMPAFHEFVTRYDSRTGVPYQQCQRCLERREELKTRGELLDGQP